MKLSWDRRLGLDFPSYNMYNIKYVEVAML